MSSNSKPAPRAALSDVNRSTSNIEEANKKPQQRRGKKDKEPMKKRSYSSHNEDEDKENTTEQIMELIQDRLLSNNTDGLVKFSQRAAGHAASLQHFYAPLSQLKDEYDNATIGSEEKIYTKKALKKKIQERIQALLVEAGFPTDSGIGKCILEMERKHETRSGNGAPDDENKYMTPPTKKLYITLLARDGDKYKRSRDKTNFVDAYRKDLANAFHQAIMTMSVSVHVENAYSVLAYLDDEANKAELLTDSGRLRKFVHKGRGGTNLVTKFWGWLVAPVLAQISVFITPRVETKEIEELKHLVHAATGNGELTENVVEDYVAKARAIMKQDTIIERSSSTNARQSIMNGNNSEERVSSTNVPAAAAPSLETNAEKKKKKKKAKDPNKPTQAKSAYMLYAASGRTTVREANPDLTFGEVTKVVAADWNAMSDENKSVWNRMAADDKERYQREMDAYKGSELETQWLASLGENQGKMQADSANAAADVSSINAETSPSVDVSKSRQEQVSVAAAASIVPNKSGVDPPPTSTSSTASATTIASATKKHTEKASSAKCQGYNVQCELCQASFESTDQLSAHMGPCFDSMLAAIDG
jgi:hypothetical protein